MLTVIVIICAIYVFAKLIGFAFKFAWGIGKALFSFLVLPILVIGLLIFGLKYILIPILIVAIIAIIAISATHARL